MPYPLCEHVMSSGIRCGSPALRGESRCYYHHSALSLLPKRFRTSEHFRRQDEQGVRLFPMPLLEDATSIQIALMQVIHAMLEGAIHAQSARIVLSALRTAQRNLLAVKLERNSTYEIRRELPSDVLEKAEVMWPSEAQSERTAYDVLSTKSADLCQADTPPRKEPDPVDAEEQVSQQLANSAAT
jgi:hypothetical protein